MDLIGRNRLICARSDPRPYRAAQSLLLQLGDDALHAPMLLNEPVDDGRHLGTDHAAQYAVEHAHMPSLLLSEFH